MAVILDVAWQQIKHFFFIRKLLIFILFLNKNICCGYSLEAPHRGASNEYPQHMFLSRNKKNIMWIPPLICSYVLEVNTFSNSESPCHFNTQSDLWFGRRCGLKNFKMAVLPSWISEQNDFSNSHLYNSSMPPVMLKLNPTYCSGADVI